MGWKWATGSFLAAVCMGCTALPEVGPFVDATHELNLALELGGEVSVAELVSIQAESQATQFDQAWQARLRAGEALVNYAESLRAIVASGDQGAQSAGQLSDSLTQLALATGVVFTGAPGALLVVDQAAQFVQEQVALVRAAESLATALNAAQPALARIAQVLELDLRQAGEIFELASLNVEQSLLTNEETQVRLGYRLALIEERQALYAEDLAAGERMERALVGSQNRLLELQALLEASAQWYDPLQGQLAAARQRRRNGASLFFAARTSTRRWAEAHANLVRAVEDGPTYSLAGLLQAAVEVRERAGRIRER